VLNGRMPRGHRGIVVTACLPCDNPWLQGQWEAERRIEMDAAFVAAMQQAGYQLTAPSTVHGTKAPIIGYQRD
jgi:hypothetical protein